MRKIAIIPLLTLLISGCGQLGPVKPLQAPQESIPVQEAQPLLSPIERPIVAVLLPQTGPHRVAATLIQNGLLAYSFEHPQAFAELRFYDTGLDEAQTSYDQAVAEGAQVIIGPLLKEHAQDLKTHPKVFNLSLNPTPAQESTWSFDFTIQGEALQLALMAQARQFDRVGILAENEEAKRALQDALAKAGIFVVAADVPPSNVTRQAQFISNFLGARASQERENLVRRIIGRSLDSQPYIRKDIHALVVSLDKVSARMIQPQRKFNYSPEIEVLAGTRLPLSDIQSTDLVDLNKFTYILSPNRASGTKSFLNSLGWDAAALSKQLTRAPQEPIHWSGRIGDYHLKGHQLISIQAATRIHNKSLMAEDLSGLDPLIDAYLAEGTQLPASTNPPL